MDHQVQPVIQDFQNLNASTQGWHCHLSACFPSCVFLTEHCGQVGDMKSHSLRQPGTLSGAQERRFQGESPSDHPSLFTLVH